MKAYYLQQMNIQTWVRREHVKIDSLPNKDFVQTFRCETLNDERSLPSNVHNSSSQSSLVDTSVHNQERGPGRLLVVIENSVIDPGTQWIIGKAGSLLTNILHSIGLTKESVALVTHDSLTKMFLAGTGDEATISNPEEQISQIDPKAILYMGENTYESICPNKLKIPVISTHSLSDLLTNPIQKKNAFMNLSRIISRLC